jgi:hypothetical protein
LSATGTTLRQHHKSLMQKRLRPSRICRGLAASLTFALDDITASLLWRPQKINGSSRSREGFTPMCSTRCFHSLPSI